MVSHHESSMAEIIVKQGTGLRDRGRSRLEMCGFSESVDPER
jgi:hypothetical protein